MPGAALGRYLRSENNLGELMRLRDGGNKVAHIERRKIQLLLYTACIHMKQQREVYIYNVREMTQQHTI